MDHERPDHADQILGQDMGRFCPEFMENHEQPDFLGRTALTTTGKITTIIFPTTSIKPLRTEAKRPGAPRPASGIIFRTPHPYGPTTARDSTTPTAAQLYDDRTAGGNQRIPNPSLKPEKTHSYELGFEHWFGSTVNMRLVGFHTYTEDKIQSIFTAANVVTNKNVGKSSSTGAELNMDLYLTPEVSTGFNYTYDKAEVDENPPTRPLKERGPLRTQAQGHGLRGLHETGRSCGPPVHAVFRRLPCQRYQRKIQRRRRAALHEQRHGVEFQGDQDALQKPRLAG